MTAVGKNFAQSNSLNTDVSLSYREAATFTIKLLSTVSLCGVARSRCEVWAVNHLKMGKRESLLVHIIAKAAPAN